MSQIPIGLADRLVLVGGADGRTLISADTPLRRLNYFDGKFLRAEHLRQEQTYLRSLVAESNRAGGPGVVHGYDVGRSGDQLQIGPGLAIDPEGRVLLLSSDETVSITELIEGARRVFPLLLQRVARPGFDDCELVRTDTTVDPLTRPELYLVSIAHAEALCGEEDVYGRLCEEACVTETARPFLVEGIVVRIRALPLAIDYHRSGVVPLRPVPHLRSLAASAYFAAEAAAIPTQISGAGLRDGPWCRGAEPALGVEVPIAVLGRRGTENIFLDPWIVRRERMEPPPRRYWAWRMNMRPWDVFLAQVLQFQCQLMALLRRARGGAGDDNPCADETSVLREAADSIKSLKQMMVGLGEQDRGALRNLVLPAAGGSLGDQLDRVLRVDDRLRDVLMRKRVNRSSRILIDGGIVELPPAGYLPVDPAAAETIESQVRRYLGAGVALRFCVAPADHLAHLFEEAQHMTRIDLLTGLDNPKRRERVEIFVPDGQFEEVRQPPKLDGFKIGVGVLKLFTTADQFIPPTQVAVAAAEGATNNLHRALSSDLLAEADTSVAELFSKKVGDDLTTTLAEANLRSRVIGAGRGEVLPTGGGLFYMAGTAPSGDGKDVLIQSMVTAFAAMGAASATAPAAPAAGAGAGAGAGAAAAAAAATAATADGESFMESFVGGAREILKRAAPDAFKPAAKKKAAKTARARAEAAAAAAAEPMEIGTFAYRNVQPYLINAQNREPGSGFWGKARIARDPFQLLPGRSTDFEVRLTIAQGAVSTTPTQVVEVSLTGALRVTGAPVTAGAITTLTAELDGKAHVEMINPNGTSVCFGRPMRQTVRLERYDDGAEEAVRIRLGTSAGGLVLLAHWPGTVLGVDAEVLVGLAVGTTVMYVGALVLDHDNAVFDPVNLYHRAAVSALEFIATAKGEPAFASREEINLFHPSDTPSGQRRIRTPRDWVLFRRWREVDCGGVQVAAPPRYRTYMTYLMALDEKYAGRFGARMSEILAQGPDEIARLLRSMPEVAARRVGPIEFEGEGSRITSDVTAYRLSYQAQGPGNRLFFAAIGSRGAAAQDPETLAKARVTTLGGTLRDISHLPNYDPFVVVPSLTDQLDPEATDGVVVIVTDQAAQTTTHEFIYMSEYNTALVPSLEAGNFRDRSSTNIDAGFEHLRFVNGIVTPESLDAVATAMDARHAPRVHRQLMVYGRAAADQAKRMAEAAQVAGRFPTAIGRWKTLPALETDADAVLLLI